MNLLSRMCAWYCGLWDPGFIKEEVEKVRQDGACSPLIPALTRQRKGDPSEFKVSLVYVVSLRTTQRNPVTRKREN